MTCVWPRCTCGVECLRYVPSAPRQPQTPPTPELLALTKAAILKNMRPRPKLKARQEDEGTKALSRTAGDE